MTSSYPAGSPPTPDATPSVREILQYFAGAAQLMAGRPEGLRKLDLSADGFWTSFFAIVVALPPLALSWIDFETVRNPAPSGAGPVLVYLVHAIAEIVAWVLPVLLLMLAAKWVGLSRKIVPLVVATNWGGALMIWMLAPFWLLELATGESDGVLGIGIALSIAAIVLTIRLCSTAIGGNLLAGTGVVILSIATSLFAYDAIATLTGIPVF